MTIGTVIYLRFAGERTSACSTVTRFTDGPIPVSGSGRCVVSQKEDGNGGELIVMNEDEWPEHVAIIRKAEFAYDLEAKRVYVKFEAWLTEGGSARLLVVGDAAIDMLNAYCARWGEQLNDRPVWVRMEPDGGCPRVNYSRPCWPGGG